MVVVDMEPARTQITERSRRVRQAAKRRLRRAAIAHRDEIRKVESARRQRERAVAAWTKIEAAVPDDKADARATRVRFAPDLLVSTIPDEHKDDLPDAVTAPIGVALRPPQKDPRDMCASNTEYVEDVTLPDAVDVMGLPLPAFPLLATAKLLALITEVETDVDAEEDPDFTPDEEDAIAEGTASFADVPKTPEVCVGRMQTRSSIGPQLRRLMPKRLSMSSTTSREAAADASAPRAGTKRPRPTGDEGSDSEDGEISILETSAPRDSLSSEDDDGDSPMCTPGDALSASARRRKRRKNFQDGASLCVATQPDAEMSDWLDGAPCTGATASSDDSTRNRSVSDDCSGPMRAELASADGNGATVRGDVGSSDLPQAGAVTRSAANGNLSTGKASAIVKASNDKSAATKSVTAKSTGSKGSEEKSLTEKSPSIKSPKRKAAKSKPPTANGIIDTTNLPGKVKSGAVMANGHEEASRNSPVSASPKRAKGRKSGTPVKRESHHEASATGGASPEKSVRKKGNDMKAKGTGKSDHAQKANGTADHDNEDSDGSHADDGGDDDSDIDDLFANLVKKKAQSRKSVAKAAKTGIGGDRGQTVDSEDNATPNGGKGKKGRRHYTQEGFRIMSIDEMKADQPKGLNGECPFDCSCCF